MGRQIKDVKKLQIHALRGESDAQASLAALNDKVAREVNKRLRELERRGYDYGGYNTPIHFTQTMYDTNRFAKSKDMDGDYMLMSTQTQIGLKFLNFESSTVAGQKAIEDRRREKFIEMEIIDEDYSPHKFRGFLRFLGNEEASAFVESWSDSEKMLDMLFTAYNKRRMSKQAMLAKFREYLDPRKKDVDLRKVMKDMGVNIDDFRRTRWR